MFQYDQVSPLGKFSSRRIPDFLTLPFCFPEQVSSAQKGDMRERYAQTCELHRDELVQLYPSVLFVSGEAALTPFFGYIPTSSLIVSSPFRMRPRMGKLGRGDRKDNDDTNAFAPASLYSGTSH